MSQFFQHKFTILEVIVILAIIVVIMGCTGFFLPVEFLFHLCFGWIFFLIRVLTQVDVDGSAVLLSALALALFVGGSHWLLRSLTSAKLQWKMRWTLSAAAIVLLMFIAGISFVGVTHQVAWMATAKEPMVSTGREVFQRVVVQNNLRQIGLGLLNYYDSAQSLPPGVSVDVEGRVLHSWMTLILPSIEHSAKYEQVKLDRRWDDPLQEKVFQKTIKVYQSPSAPREQLTDAQKRPLTHFSANQHVISGTGTRSFAEIPDGLSNTVLVGEAAGNFVPWGKPGNWRDPAEGLNRSPSGFGSRNKSGVVFSFADGSVRRLDPKTSPDVLKALATPAGGEAVNENDY